MNSIVQEIPTPILQLLTAVQAWHYMVLPYALEDNTLFLYTDKPNQTETKNELELLLGKSIHLEEIDSEIFRQQLASLYRKQDNGIATSVRLDIADSKELLKNLVREAKQLGSSDIHLEPYETTCRIRMRIDGQMIERYVLEKREYPSLVNKIKIQSQLDIAEKRLPQDGRIFLKNIEGKKLDIRVSVLPTLHGEKIVMRLLSNDASGLALNQLGLAGLNKENYLEGVQRPNGMVLISGPTGSGKTTTLYATLGLLNKTTRNILTIEDPIEYTLEGINQVQLKETIGLDFASAMRTFLRQDPDIIMVGEIRDAATASMAIRASLTGHLVMSTIHTNSAWGIVSRLADMDVPPYLLADTLNTAVAQRLLRLLCPLCKKESKFNQQLLPKRYKAPQELLSHFEANGCEHCFYTGYKGRKAIYEVIPIDNELSDKIKAKSFKVQDLLKERGIRSLSDNAFELLAKGETSIKECYPILLNA